MESRYFNIKYPMLDSFIAYKGNNYGRKYDLDESIGKGLIKKYEEFLENKKKEFPYIWRYFGSKIHDSQFVGYERKNSGLSLTLNDMSAHCLIDSMCENGLGKIKHKSRIMKLTIEFEGIENLSCSRLNNRQKMLPVSLSKFLPRLDSYLYEEIKELEKINFKAGFIFIVKKPIEFAVLEIQCREIRFVEEQEKCFLDFFRTESIPIFYEYWNRRIEGEYFDYKKFDELIKKHAPIKANNRS